MTALQNSENVDRLVVDNAVIGIALSGRDGKWIRVNRALGAMLGYTEAELLELNFTKITQADDVVIDQESLQKLRAGEVTSFTHEKRYIHKDGHLFWVRVHVAGVYDSDGVLTHHSTQVVDISRTYELEQEARLYSERLHNVIEGTDAGTWEWDCVTGDIVINDRWAEIVGYTRDELEPTTVETWKRLIHPDDLIHAMELLDRHFDGDLHAYDLEVRMQHKEGHWVWVHNRGKLFERSDQGRPLRVAGTHIDITQRKRDEAALLAANNALVKSNRDLEQFAYVASHDLQEPLRMVASFTKLLSRNYADELDDKAREYINFAADGAQRMQQLIKDLLSYSRIGQGYVDDEAVDLNLVQERVVRSLQLSNGNAAAEIYCGPLPVVHGDPGQLQQLLHNLVANAIKYRGDKPIEVTIGTDQRNAEMVFFVRDNGIGIDPENFERIFEIFQRLHARSEYAGTGIGLAICKRIVERHGGRIWVESALGEGATFFFTLHPDRFGTLESTSSDDRSAA